MRMVAIGIGLIALTPPARSSPLDDRPPELTNPSVVERLPPIERSIPQPGTPVALRFRGTHSFTDEELRTGISRQIEAIADFGLNEASAFDAGYFVEVFYRRHGFAFVSIDPRIVAANTLELVVSEGPRVRVGSIRIIGNSHKDSDMLTRYLLGPTRERFPKTRTGSDLPFVEADVQAGVDLVRRLYAAEGFLDARVADPRVRYSPDLGMADVIVRITEGLEYRFGDIRFTGEPAFPADQLAPVIAAETSRPFTDGGLEAARRALDDFYKRRGYFEATVEANGSPAAARRGRVPVVFRIAAGRPFHFDGITVTGLDRVTPGFMENRFDDLEGDFYSPDRIDEKHRELIETGLFRKLEIEPHAIAGDRIRLDVAVEEAQAKEFSFGAGFGTYEGAIVSLGFSNHNFLRTGRSLRFDAEMTSRGLKGELVHTNRWLFETDFSLRTRLYALRRDLDGYEKFEYGFHPALSRKLNEHWEISAFALIKNVSIEESRIEPRELLGVEEYTLASVGVSQTVDYRNNRANPSRGFIWTLSMDGGAGGDIPFFRTSGQFSFYLPVTRRTVLAFGARAGVIVGADDDFPIDERFFNGGASTVRSFQERELGPKDLRGHPIGGEAYTAFNVEYSFPIRGDLRGAVFADAGNVLSDAGLFEFDDMRYAVGVGLRYQLPIGAVRVDFGLNPAPREDEHVGALHLSFGVTF